MRATTSSSTAAARCASTRRSTCRPRGTSRSGPGGGTINTNGFDTTIQQIIDGTGGLTKDGDGTLTLWSNTFNGGTTINDGVLAVTSDSSLGASTGALTMNGGTLRFDSSIDLSPSRTITLNAAAAIIDTNGNDASIPQSIGGTGGLTKTGAGTLALGGTNTYGGGTTIAGGAILIASDAGLGDTFGRSRVQRRHAALRHGVRSFDRPHGHAQRRRRDDRHQRF
jgi:autotransporter-associated beta strand protein